MTGSPASSTTTFYTTKALPDPPMIPGDIYAHDTIPPIYKELIQSFNDHSSLTNHGKLTCIRSRKRQLLALARLIQENEESILNALERPTFETQVYEITATLKEIHRTFRGVAGSKRGKGVVLIVSHFSYPLYTSLVPLAWAIASGNCVVLHSSGWIGGLVGRYLDPDVVRVVDTSAMLEKLLNLPWAHIYFIGSRETGKMVACAAAKDLIPITLRMGGRSPLFLDSTNMCMRSLVRATKKILWAKSINAGQTLGVPDAVLVLAGEEERVIDAFRNAHAQLFPNGSPPPASLTRLIDTEAFDRVASILTRTKGAIIIGGETVREKRYVAPTVVRGVPLTDALLEGDDGVFAPIVPIVPLGKWEDAVRKDDPGTVYVFSEDRGFRRWVIQTMSSTNVVINQIAIHPPIGGRTGLDTFSHQRDVSGSGFFQRLLPSSLRYRYPPYTDAKFRIVRMLMFGFGGGRFPAHV